MPNWSLTYSGLGRLPWVKDHFKSVTLRHAYRSTYAIGSYATYQSFQSYMGDLGFVDDVQSGLPVPSSRYDVSMASINEQFAPLVGLDLSWKNGLTTTLEYRSTRVLNLSTTALQVVETSSRDMVVGLGYKLVGVKLFGPRSRRPSKGGAFSNDLTLRADLSWRNQSALCRDIMLGTAQATSGNRALKLSCTADYALSRLLTLRLYFDRQQNTPLVSASSYPMVTTDFGLSVQFSLSR